MLSHNCIERRAYQVTDTGGFPPSLRSSKPYTVRTGAPSIRVQLSRQLRTSGGMVHVAATHNGPTMLMAPESETCSASIAALHPALLALLIDTASSQRELASAAAIAKMLGAGWKRASVWKALAELSRACRITTARAGSGVVVTLVGSGLTVTIARAPASAELAA